MKSLLAEHVAAPRNRGRLVHPTGARVYVDPLSGDALRIQIRVNHGHLSEVRFLGFGHPALTGVASFVTEAVQGQSLEILGHLSSEYLVQALGLAPQEAHYAQMVLLTLLEAVQDHHRRQRLEREVGP